MSDEPELILSKVGYNEQLVLYYLDKAHSLEEGLVNLQKIIKDTGLTHTTLRKKLDTLESLKLIFITRKGKEKVVMITEKGKGALSEWKNTIVGKQLIGELETELSEKAQSK